MANIAKFPGSATSINNTTSTVDWQNASDVIGDTTNYAYIELTTSTPLGDFLTVSNFGFDISPLASIDGMVVVVDRISDQDRSINDENVQIMISGVPYGTNKYGGYWTDTWTEVTYGSPTDKWGILGDVAQVNDSAFGVGISPEFGDVYATTVEGQIRSVEVTVYYTVHGMSVGSSEIKKIYLGSSEVQAVYQGSTDLAHNEITLP